jgi:xanthine dehydrogenase accessory factor
LLGEPSPIDGIGRERFVYAPECGRFATACAIGQAVSRGEAVARVGAHPIRAPIDGQIRGLSHDGAAVEAGSKVLEVVPVGSTPCFGLGQRPGRIADGVVRAIDAWAAAKA